MSGQFVKNNAWGDWDQEVVQDSPRIMEVDIFEVDTSHVNPRQTRGENYESTKDSIRSIGLQSILTITKVPGNERYSLYNGGNTRLTILKELYEEYLQAGEHDKAEKLRLQQCRYVPWTDDLDSLVKQMAENEERSPMTFIDKARAVFRIQQLYLHQYGVDEVSHSKLVKYIHSLGWTSVNRPSMTELSFAFEALENVIPLALSGGMGKPKVQQLRQFLGDLELWLEWLANQHGAAFGVADGRNLYFQVLSEHDDDASINLDAFFDDFLLRLGDVLVRFDPQWTSTRIRFELEQVRELGHVPDTVSMAELGPQLEATSSLPPSSFPTPRKEREKRQAPNETGYGNPGQAAKSLAGAGHPEAPSVPGDDEFNLSSSTSAGPVVSARPRNPNLLLRHPDVELPDRKLPSEAFTAAIRERSQALIRSLIKQIDHKDVLKELLVFDGEENLFNDLPPYLFIRLDEEWQYTLIRDWLSEASDAEQYGALYVLSLLNFYLHEVYRFEDDTPDPVNTKRHLRQLWDEFGWRFLKHHFNYQTGALYAVESANSRYAIAMLFSSRVMHEHSGLLYGLENHSPANLERADPDLPAASSVPSVPNGEG